MTRRNVLRLTTAVAGVLVLWLVGRRIAVRLSDA